MRAQFVLQEVWTGLRRNLTMTIALIVVVAISLSLLGTGFLFVKQVNNTRTYWQGKVQLSIYLCTKTSVSPRCQTDGPATAAEKAQIASDLKALPQVKLRNAQTDFTLVAQTVQGRPGVDQIVNDATLLSKFYKLLDGARNGVVIIAIVLIIAAILLVANTIRLSAFNRRRETSIMRLVGASNFYVQLPFLVEGVLAGLLGWLIAAALLVAVKSLGLDTLQQYFPYNVTLSATDLIEVIAFAMVMGVVLCGVTSFFTLRRYLRA